MAHTLRFAPALLAALLAALPARGVELGALEVGSALGEPLDARVPLKAAPGERFEAACFFLSHGGLPEGARLAMALERSARGTALRIRGSTPLEVPAASLRVTVACPGQEAQPPRDYALLLDPPMRIRPATAGPAPAIGATIAARDAASLDSIAQTLFPRDAKARALYLEALAAANPTLAARGTSVPIEAGAPVALPDLRTFAATRRAAAQGAVPAAREERLAEAPAAPARSPARSAPRVPPVETEPPPPPTRAALPAKPAVAKPAPASPQPAAQESAPPSPKAGPAPAPEAAPQQPPAAPVAKAQPAPAAKPDTAARVSSAKPDAAPKGTPRAERAGDGFVLRLSGSEIDLSRSRGVDDRRRAQLRERQLVLDADDQLSALLAMRHSLKQLEARVSELQLKLAGMPASFPERPAAGAPKPAASASPEPPRTPAAPSAPAPGLPDRPRTTAPPQAAPSAPAVAGSPPATTPSKAAAPAAPAETAPLSPPVATPPPPAPPVAPAAAAKDAAPAPAPAPPGATPAPRAAVPPPATAPAVSAPAAKPASATPPPGSRSFDALWRDYAAWIVGLLVLLAVVLALAMWRRRAAAAGDAIEDEEALPEPEPPVAGDVGEIAAPVAAALAAEPQRATISSDAHLPTRLRDTDSGDLRRRYIEERFPEVASRAIRLEDTDSVVKGARLFYEDGEIPRAVELLQLAIEARPDEARLWLALFEIFRLERLAGEFGELARRFQERFGDTDHWRKVQFFGREVDPGNPLYKAEPVATLETIGPREARKLAAARAAFDPIAENWLNAPMDFENEVLANDLRRSLMAEAGIAENDLMPAPMNALRNVEVFTVA